MVKGKVHFPKLKAKRLAEFIGLVMDTDQEKKILELIIPQEKIYQTRLRIQRDREMTLQRELRNRENELKDIFDSRGWKIISFLHKLRMSVPFLRDL